MTSAVSFSHLKQAGTSVLVALDPTAGPRVLHWGGDLGPIDEAEVAALVAASLPVVSHSAFDAVQPRGLLAASATGFAGRPSVEGFRPTRAAAAVSPLFTGWAISESTPMRLAWTASDEESSLDLLTGLELTATGLLRLQHTLVNAGQDSYAVQAVRTALPLPAVAQEVLDLTGRWCRERAPQRRLVGQGSWVRESRRGRTGHDATLMMLAGVPGFGFGHGEVWGVHVAWSGDHVTFAERLPETDAQIGGGELLAPGEVVLDPGEKYRTPWLYAAWSDQGIDGISHRVHGYLRSRPTHPTTPRPVVLNTWEAVYFEHRLDTLQALATAAAEVGIERFVLDDGWFVGRDTDRSALGDWRVDPGKWPDGLHPLVEHVTRLGLDFGLWVEPEMVNLDSDLAREHPDWVLRGRAELPPTWRHQHVLDLQNPDAFAFVRDSLLALLDEYDIAYLKWDHNRDLVDGGHGGRPAVHGQTLAFYALVDALKSAHPEVEIESCASGGGRVDLAVLERTDRIWTSDCNDALERQHIQRWTQLLVPPELTGAHVGARTAHTTGRTHALAFRAATALFGHFGVELDLTVLDDDERAELAAWISFHKEHRALLHTGRVVRGDHPDPSLYVHGVVSQHQAEALYALVGVASSATTVPVSVRLPGLDPDRMYRVAVHDVAAPPHGAYHAAAGIETGDTVLSGRVLGTVGITVSIVLPESARLIRAVGE